MGRARAQRNRDEAHLGKRVKGAVYIRDNSLVPYVRKDAGSKQVKHGFGFVVGRSDRKG
jgi:hypothetical protein